ncbi:hypothetical protein AVEN_178155-1 [Araneus ventricosus]|uniref:Uncharacterized protein n=1 Tax=Araneus ventricosus TaxID=182803 RepID=A0A4Y1ZSL7_ARAVE|nr:hypothetical protein AVEN_178155-1 [Araneus ventricosus]
MSFSSKKVPVLTLLHRAGGGSGLSKISPSTATKAGLVGWLQHERREVLISLERLAWLGVQLSLPAKARSVRLIGGYSTGGVSGENDYKVGRNQFMSFPPKVQFNPLTHRAGGSGF